jgi:hypothetical protein
MGEFARTLNLTCVHTGWVFTRTVRNNAHAHILSALKAAVEEVPVAVTGLDVDNGTEFLNKAVIKWAALWTSRRGGGRGGSVGTAGGGG